MEFHASVEDELEAAVQWVAREVFEHKTPLDQIAIYVPVLDPLAGMLVQRLGNLPWTDPADPPVYVADGLPVRQYSSACRIDTVLSALENALSAESLHAVLPSLEPSESSGFPLSFSRAGEVVYSCGAAGGTPGAAGETRGGTDVTGPDAPRAAPAPAGMVADTTVGAARRSEYAPMRDAIDIALLQANTSREIKWKHGYEGIVVEDLLVRTHAAAAAGAELVIWPETAAPMMILWEPDLAKRVRESVAEAQAWTLVGTLDAVLKGGGDFDAYNAAMLYDPTGRLRQRYYKMRLVPFSEAMPWSRQIPWMNALNFGQSDFRAGQEQTVLHAGKHPFAVLICFESIFPELSRERVRRGARDLVNITNDFWFGRSAGPTQHAEMAILRAVENRTPLARCANSGISFFVDPWGRVTQRTGLFVEAQPIARVRAGTGGSFYTHHGAALGHVLRAVGALMLAWAGWNGWRARGRRTAREEQR